MIIKGCLFTSAVVLREQIVRRRFILQKLRCFEVRSLKLRVLRL